MELHSSSVVSPSPVLHVFTLLATKLPSFHTTIVCLVNVVSMPTGLFGSTSASGLILLPFKYRPSAGCQRPPTAP
eukprot:365417-Chlamydomonas_euryale.AAC.21